MNNLNVPGQEKKTLMGVLENLNSACNRLDDAANLTVILNKKLNRTENEACVKEDGDEVKALLQKDIVDLFEDVVKKIDRLTHKIGYNSEKSIQMIE